VISMTSAVAESLMRSTLEADFRRALYTVVPYARAEHEPFFKCTARVSTTSDFDEAQPMPGPRPAWEFARCPI